MKLCKDCKHIGKSPFGTLTYCHRPIDIDVVSGDANIVGNYCSVERSVAWLNARVFKMCGKEGRYFEEKEETCS